MILPEKYQGIKEDELKKRVHSVKGELGDELAILCHHYQRDDVYEFADFTGDSFKLAQDAASRSKSKHIVFCGVHFMAEAARILCADNQRVFLPNMDAGCPMADMASLDEVEVVWDMLSGMTDISKIVPITYMNSTAAIKAFCGKNGGVICTSSNAGRLFDWAFGRGEKVLFIPDRYLGANTARSKGFKGEEILLLRRDEENSGLNRDLVKKSKVIVWDGFCHVHTAFTLDHINEARKKYPRCKIIVHPESVEDVVEASDEVGSTEQIRKYVESSPKNSTIIIGTEINMVNRLANQNMDKTVLPLERSLCPNMFKISLNSLCWTLEELGLVNEIFVPEDVAGNAKIALRRMLENA